MRKLVAEVGETIRVHVLNSDAVYRVPRHYIALHGLKTVEVPALAARYGWKKEEI